ncbi:MAG: nucleotide pyrophosphohydrolase [Phycisphaerales bacterium]|nr:nucleotide pyrophosphohydrolase [Phycisphaerales bacterium]
MSRKMTDECVTVAALRAMMREFVGEREWDKYHTPKNLAMSVAVEAAELLELFQWLTPEAAAVKSRKGGDPEFRRAVAEEMSDVLMYLISLANTLDLDVASSVAAKMKKNRLKYPREKVKGHYQRPRKA